MNGKFVAIVASGLAAAWWALSADGNKKVFVSYRERTEGRYKNLLKAWSKNAKFDIEFDDLSIGTSIDSENSSYIRKRIRERIKESDVVLVLVGKETAKSEWVEWEVGESLSERKRVVAIKIDGVKRIPNWMRGESIEWLDEFNKENILSIF